MALEEPGDADRFNAMYRRHVVEIASYCRWRSRSESDAEDAVAEVFATLWRKLAVVPQGDASRIWLYATARRVTANQLRSLRRRASLAERVRTGLSGQSVDATLFGSDQRSEIVSKALQTLRPLDRETLLLSEWEELTPSEIGEVVGCSPGSARVRLHRARKRFRAVFETMLAEPKTVLGDDCALACADCRGESDSHG